MVDAHAQVHGLSDVLAAGDITSFPVKRGGIAAQQAEAAAEMIAATAGADITPQPVRLVLRGLLLTGQQPRYLRHELTGGAGDVSAAREAPAAPGAIPVELEETEVDRFAALRLEIARDAEAEEGTTVGDVMSSEPLVVAPKDALG